MITKQFNAKPQNLLLLLLISGFLWSCAPMGQNSEIGYQHTSIKQYEHTTRTQPSTDIEETISLSGEDDSADEALEQMTIPEPEETVAQEVKELEELGPWDEKYDEKLIKEEKGVEYDFPITINRQVEYYLDLFQNRSRKSFGRWLARSGRYVPLIQAHLKEEGLPLDLAYLPMIESGYSLNALSSAKAAGPWQFMRGTALNFGLKVDSYVDERRDPIKSTTAATSYLKALYAEFNSWELAVAGYNAGEGRIRRVIKKFDTNDFWKLAEKKSLPLETKRYVPKLIAAIIIAKEPEKYGFTDIQLDAPLDFEYARVPRWTSLNAVATALNAPFDEILELNRELKKHVTPPDEPSYNLKIPAGSQETLAANLPRVRSKVKIEYKSHVVKNGDSLERICATYNINKTTLLKANNLRKSKLANGTILRIPHQVTNYVLLSEEEMQNTSLASYQGDDFILHKIKPGETIGKIASKYGVSSRLIASWNDIQDLNKIRAGQQLALYIDNSANTPVSDHSAPQKIKNKNSQPQVALLKDSKKTPVNTDRKKQTATYYRVKGGDNLWKIARQFKVEATDIKKWNNLKNNTIHPGLKLELRVSKDADA